MDTSMNMPPANFESVWAEIQRERPVPKVVSKEEAEYNRKIRKMKSYRYYFDDDGLFCFDGFYTEEYFLTAFRHGKQTFFGEKFETIENHFNSIGGYTYDLIMYNDVAVAIINLEYTACEKAISDLLKKVEDIRSSFLAFNNHKVYLGLATMAFYPELEQECIKQGIAIIKQVGDTVVINDEHLKAF